MSGSNPMIRGRDSTDVKRGIFGAVMVASLVAGCASPGSDAAAPAASGYVGPSPARFAEELAECVEGTPHDPPAGLTQSTGQRSPGAQPRISVRKPTAQDLERLRHFNDVARRAYTPDKALSATAARWTRAYRLPTSHVLTRWLRTSPCPATFLIAWTDPLRCTCPGRKTGWPHDENQTDPAQHGLHLRPPRTFQIQALDPHPAAGQLLHRHPHRRPASFKPRTSWASTRPTPTRTDARANVPSLVESAALDRRNGGRHPVSSLQDVVDGRAT
jgi:hypothetical protein